jgi:hypothetical protein
MKRVFLLLSAAILAFASCDKKDDQGKDGIYKGPVTKFHNGKAWTWVQLDSQNKPQRIAISIDDAAMNSLPAATGDMGHDMGNMANHLVLKFHEKASATPFLHALLDWNPAGHEPENVYTLPHFDFHFYTTPDAERAAIPPYEVDSTGFLNFPAPAYLPANYLPTPGGVPQMGAHWVDVTSPELNGQPFSQTFLMGTFNGKVNFYEPMITKAFLDANPNFEREVGAPAKFQQSGYYPAKMRIVKKDGVTNIILEEFVHRTQS